MPVAGFFRMDTEPAPPGITEHTDNRPATVKVRSGVELGTMRWVLIIGMIVAIAAMIGAAAWIY